MVIQPSDLILYSVVVALRLCGIDGRGADVVRGAGRASEGVRPATDSDPRVLGSRDCQGSVQQHDHTQGRPGVLQVCPPLLFRLSGWSLFATQACLVHVAHVLARFRGMCVSRCSDTAKRMDMATVWREHVVHVLHIAEGSQIAMYCLAYSPPKVPFLPVLCFVVVVVCAVIVSGGGGNDEPNSASTQIKTV